MCDSNQFAGPSVVEIACQCGRSACAEVIALPQCVYEQAQGEPRRRLLAPGHELPGIGRALSRFDSFVVVPKEEADGGRESRRANRAPGPTEQKRAGLN